MKKSLGAALDSFSPAEAAKQCGGQQKCPLYLQTKGGQMLEFRCMSLLLRTTLHPQAPHRNLTRTRPHLPHLMLVITKAERGGAQTHVLELLQPA